MSAIVWSDVTSLATEFASLATPFPAQVLFLSVANGPGVCAANFGGEDSDLTRAARILYCAHLENIRRRRGVTGATASQSEGGASQAYWMGLASPQHLDLTGYGSLLALISAGTPARAGFVGG